MPGQKAPGYGSSIHRQMQKKYAKEHPKEQVVFLSVGFETTTPAGCLSVKKAGEDGLSKLFAPCGKQDHAPRLIRALKGECGCVPLSGTCQCDHRNCAL